MTGSQTRPNPRSIYRPQEYRDTPTIAATIHTRANREDRSMHQVRMDGERTMRKTSSKTCWLDKQYYISNIATMASPIDPCHLMNSHRAHQCQHQRMMTTVSTRHPFSLYVSVSKLSEPQDCYPCAFAIHGECEIHSLTRMMKHGMRPMAMTMMRLTSQPRS